MKFVGLFDTSKPKAISNCVGLFDTSSTQAISNDGFVQLRLRVVPSAQADKARLFHGSPALDKIEREIQTLRNFRHHRSKQLDASLYAQVRFPNVQHDDVLDEF